MKGAFVSLLGVVVTFGLVSAQPGPTPSPYAHIAELPGAVNGQTLGSLKFDPLTQRVYAGSTLGVYWAELGKGELRWRGPLMTKRLGAIEIAPELGRLFYSTIDEIGYVDLRGDPAPIRLTTGKVHSTDMVYEPERQRLYVSEARSPRVMVFDGSNGERAPDIVVPGWSARSLEAVPGRVFLQVEGKSGLYAIDARTHTVAPWKVNGDLVTPAYLEADPSGRFLFATYDRYIVMINVATASVVDRVIAPSGAAIAYDPGTGLLVANWAHPDDQPRIRVIAYRPGPEGLTLEREFTNPGAGGVGLEPLEKGFIQRGHNAYLVWQLAETR